VEVESLQQTGVWLLLLRTAGEEGIKSLQDQSVVVLPILLAQGGRRREGGGPITTTMAATMAITPLVTVRFLGPGVITNRVQCP
jgi:hypothetical protein